MDSKTNEITAIPAFIELMALKGVVFAFDAISTKKKTAEAIIDSDNDYVGALHRQSIWIIDQYGSLKTDPP